MSPAIGYRRVSTKKQGDSGLGLDAQKDIVEAFAKREGYDVIEWHTEVVSGKHVVDHIDHRPVLTRALKSAKEKKMPLMVAKLDRLSRSVLFIAGLIESKVNFVICDIGVNADPMVLQILAAVAESERRKIGERTKAALAALKKRGVKLGNPRLDIARKFANIKTLQNDIEAMPVYEKAVALLVEEFGESHLRLRDLADKMNDIGSTTSTGAKWSPESVRRLINRGSKA